MEALAIIQSKLKAPKGQTNQFGNYKYRKAEDILEAVKPALTETKSHVTMDDEIVVMEGRFFLKATATLTCGTESVKTTAWAEMETHKGMSREQMTGAASSYARKYALCGLFAIDDSKGDPDNGNVYQEIENAPTYEALTAIWNGNKPLQADAQFIEAVRVKSLQFKPKQTTKTK